MASDMGHIIKLFYPQANQRIEDPLKELNFDEVMALHLMDQPSKFVQAKTTSLRQKDDANYFKFANMPSMFKIQKKLVSKTLRAKLFQLKSYAFDHHDEASSQH